MTQIENQIENQLTHLLNTDPYLKPYAPVLKRRLIQSAGTEQRLTRGRITLCDFASGHEYFGLHRGAKQWVLREWAPNASAVYLVGDLTGWQEKKDFALRRISPDGVWEIRLPVSRLGHQDLYRLRIHWPEGQGDRIPAYARRVVQDPDSLIFNAQVWRPKTAYQWQCPDFKCHRQPLLVYEVHVGMAQEAEKVGSYQEFKERVLPRVIAAGYNTLQLMAIPEHPYYGSFGYHVSSFFAASSRFGTPEDLKALIDAAHLAGINVIMDLVHSHAVANEVEGLSRFDGTTYQYFHAGPRGIHQAWDSRCFDYGKIQVLHFLLSNCRYWLDEYHFDGFRFDGITSMLYLHHGLGQAFNSYDPYFDDTVDEDALSYLSLANRLIHHLRPDAITIAEDISGMPGLATSQEQGGTGFDFRFAMGVPDYWIRLTKDIPDEDWPMSHLWHELTNRRQEEKTISYAESHDQALVGDQTLIFRLIGAEMYDHMHADRQNLKVDRGMALHKMIRLITLATADSGYLNFMGNEFGHPEWIDFPRAGNNWSYHYARRQWHLLEDANLRYHFLADFDREMIRLTREAKLLEGAQAHHLYDHGNDKILAFTRAELVFVFNFHPTQSYVDYHLPAPMGKYRLILESDAVNFGGHGRLISDQEHFSLEKNAGNFKQHVLSLYLPNRTALVLKRVD
jgi:1,4-alpha-glucan branching enzyme